MTQMYDEEDYINPDPNAEHDEWEQTIKNDPVITDDNGNVIGNLKTVNERYRIRQSALDYPRLWCGTCNIPLPHDPTVLLADFLEVAKQHEAEVHS